MKNITINMVKMWHMSDTDWMGYQLLSRKDMFTYHHCLIKKANGGQETIENGAILNRMTSHDYINVIEIYDLDMYVRLNQCLMLVNQQRTMPTNTQLRAMYDILTVFERDHCGDRTNKGKLLIKEEYTRRGKI